MDMPGKAAEVLKKTEGKGLVFYDGECGFCQFWVQFILERDSAGHFLFAPLQAPWAAELHGRAAKKVLETILLLERGEVFERSTAVLRVFGRLGWPWKLAKIFLLVPSALRNAVYDAIARRRHGIMAAPTCRIPSPEERERFL
jgi:predicted DCC family thiol-disulfide oxidoreductase YuxK